MANLRGIKMASHNFSSLIVTLSFFWYISEHLYFVFCEESVYMSANFFLLLCQNFLYILQLSPLCSDLQIFFPSLTFFFRLSVFLFCFDILSFRLFLG